MPKFEPLVSVITHAQDASVYLQFGCDQCHGMVGQGGGAGLRLAPDPLEYDDFADIVRRPYGVMPAYSPKVLSEEDMAARKAQWQPPAPPAKSGVLTKYARLVSSASEGAVTGGNG